MIMVRKFAAKPMQADFVAARSPDTVHDYPQIVFAKENRTMMDTATCLSLEAVVFSAAYNMVISIREFCEPRFGPVEIFETTVMEHLIVAIDRYRVVNGGISKMAVPLFRTVV